MSQSSLRSFIHRDDGFVMSSELLLLGTIVVLGLIVGFVSIRNSLLLEYQDFSRAIGLLVQSYSYAGVSDASGTTAGGLFEDSADGDDTGLMDIAVAADGEL